MHFRSGKTVPKDGLRAVWLKSVNGYPLVLKLFSLLERLKEDCQ